MRTQENQHIVSEPTQSAPTQQKSLVDKMASRYGVDSIKFWNALKTVAFRQQDGSAPTDDQMLALCVVADQYGLNPMTKEIYAFADRGAVVPVVGVDGWVSMVTRQKDFRGVHFTYSDQMVRMPGANVDGHVWVECTITREGVGPITVREYLDEVYKPPGRRAGPWQSHTKRMHRHKAFVQAARMTYGFSGIYDPDEATNIRLANKQRDSGYGNTYPGEIDTSHLLQDEVQSACSLEELSAAERDLYDKLIARANDQQCWSAAIEWVSNHQQLRGEVKSLIKRDLAANQASAGMDVDMTPPPTDDPDASGEQASA
nr:recombinase RecT [uncultured Halomonas sp.]